MNAATRIATDDVFCEADAVMDRIKKQLLSTTSMTLSDATQLVGRSTARHHRGRSVEPALPQASSLRALARGPSERGRSAALHADVADLHAG
jgi:hypothetical protein